MHYIHGKEKKRKMRGGKKKKKGKTANWTKPKPYHWN